MLFATPVQGPHVAGFGAFAPTDFDCRQRGAYFACVPRTEAIRNQIRALQRTIDRVLNFFPIFNIQIENADQPPPSPILNTPTGYDGVIGPYSYGFGYLAVFASYQLLRDAGRPEPSDPVLVKALRRLDPHEGVRHYSIYAVEIREFLDEIGNQFDRLVDEALERSRRKAAAAGEPAPVSILLDPPRLPDEVERAIGRRRGWPWWAWALLGLGTAGAVTGTVIAVRRSRQRRGLPDRRR